jgi:hypothetical protein
MVPAQQLIRGSADANVRAMALASGRRFGFRACAACGVKDGELRPGDDAGYVLFCAECAASVDPFDPYFEVGGEG